MPLELVLRVETRRKAAIIGVLFTMHVPSMIQTKSLTLAGVEMSLWDGRVLCMWSDDGYTQQNEYPGSVIWDESSLGVWLYGHSGLNKGDRKLWSTPS